MRNALIVSLSFVLLMIAPALHAAEAQRYPLGNDRTLELIPLESHMWTQGYGVRITDAQQHAEPVIVDEYDVNTKTLKQTAAAPDQEYFSDASFDKGILTSGGRAGPDAVYTDNYRLQSSLTASGMNHHFVLTRSTKTAINADQSDGKTTIVYAEPAPIPEMVKKPFDIRRWQSWGNATPNQFSCAAESLGAKAPAGYSCKGVAAEKARAGIVPDPCAMADYYAGPWQENTLPKEVARTVHPSAISGSIHWNAGFLQSIAVSLDRRFNTKEDALAGVKPPLPSGNEQMKIGWSHCAKDHDCISVSYFDAQEISQFGCKDK